MPRNVMYTLSKPQSAPATTATRIARTTNDCRKGSDSAVANIM